MSRCTLDPAALYSISLTSLSLSLDGLSRAIQLSSTVTCAVRTPNCTQLGLGSFPFARRYSGNRCFFLFLRLLRCFSSPGYLLISYLIQIRMHTHYCMRVSPFGNLRIYGYVRLPAAYRSLSRPSSAPVARASTLCSCSLNLLNV